MAAISTEGRVFVAQLTRDLAAREAAGANALSPGAKQWPAAFRSFSESLSKAGSPTKAAKMFRTAFARLEATQKQQYTCVLNCFMGLSRTGFLEVMTFEVGRHPLVDAREEGVIVWLYRCRLRRRGQIEISTHKLAFISWHALARMHERSAVDIFGGGGLVAGCGIAGHLMRRSSKHANTQLNLTIGDITAAGVLRISTRAEQQFACFDVLTVLAIDEAQASKQPQRIQGIAILHAALEYFRSGDPDPRRYTDKIPVLPCRDDDFVSRTLKQVKTGGI
jgi:hypothetical protein